MQSSSLPTVSASPSISADKLKELACVKATERGCDLFQAMAEVVSEKFVPLSDLEEVESVIAGQPPDSVQGRVFVPEAVRRQQTVKTLRLKAKNDQDLTQLYYFASKYSEENKCAVAIELPDCPGCGLGSEKSRCVMQ